VGLLADYRPHHPVTRLVLLATFLPGCQRDLKVLINMLPEIFNVLALLTIMITFYAWFGAVMFVDTVEGSQHFSSLVESMWTLVCSTHMYPSLWICFGIIVVVCIALNCIALHCICMLSQSYCLTRLFVVVAVTIPYHASLMFLTKPTVHLCHHC
jgi:hypothetical protein